MCSSVLQYGVVCCSVSKCFAACCSVLLQCVYLCRRRVCVYFLWKMNAMCGAVCYSVLQCVAGCCRVFQCVAACRCSVFTCVEDISACIVHARSTLRVLQCVAACCSVLECVEAYWSVLLKRVYLYGGRSSRCVAACCSILECVGVCFSMLECDVAACLPVWRSVKSVCAVKSGRRGSRSINKTSTFANLPTEEAVVSNVCIECVCVSAHELMVCVMCVCDVCVYLLMGLWWCVTARSVEDETRNARWNAKRNPEWSSQVSF